MNSSPIGGVSGEGITTQVGINQPKLDPSDEKVLCAAMCFCEATPNISKDGKSLKQSCVDQRLRELDSVFVAHGGRSSYRPEVSYDMTKAPPVPILDRDGVNKHRYVPGWIKKYWAEDLEHPPFERGEGMIRRPDVIIVRDPRKPPSQDNIKMVVEMKFPPDELKDEQEADYVRIAGSKAKLEIMGPDRCNCEQVKEEVSVPFEALDGLIEKGVELLWVLSRGKMPRLPRVPRTPRTPRPAPAH